MLSKALSFLWLCFTHIDISSFSLFYFIISSNILKLFVFNNQWKHFIFSNSEGSLLFRLAPGAQGINPWCTLSVFLLCVFHHFCSHLFLCVATHFLSVLLCSGVLLSTSWSSFPQRAAAFWLSLPLIDPYALFSMLLHLFFIPLLLKSCRYILPCFCPRKPVVSSIGVCVLQLYILRFQCFWWVPFLPFVFLCCTLPTVVFAHVKVSIPPQHIPAAFWTFNTM